jgi:hypothetical protein
VVLLFLSTNALVEILKEKFQKIELQTGAHVKVITVSLPAGVQNMTNEGLNQLYTTVS